MGPGNTGLSVKNSTSSLIEIRKVFQKAVKLFFWEKCEALKAALASLASMPSLGNLDKMNWLVMTRKAEIALQMEAKKAEEG